MKKNNEVVVLIGAGAIGIAIVRRISAGKHILLADISSENIESAAKSLLEAGFVVSSTIVDICSSASVNELAEKATSIGSVTNLIHAAGVSPSQASPEKILKVDLYGTALVVEIFGKIIAQGGSGIVIASQSGYRLPALTAEEVKALAITPVEELLKIPLLEIEKIKDSLHAYQISKRANSLRVRAEAVRWGKRGARINALSPGIIITPLAKDELAGPRGDVYRKMINTSPAGRPGTPDEVASVAALLMSQDGAFITGSDILMDGGVTANFFYGD